MPLVSAAGIRFEQVWKKFRSGQVHDSLRDLIPSLLRRAGTRSAHEHHGLEKREFWALQDVSFHVAPGEALGIIGPNGAGKSTVLKVLNRILRPTHGMAEIRGRVGALIEISAGFHQDLTGGENIFLQGAIMGMKKREIEQKFDQIVEFSGVGEFITTPVKRYSSGMNARLGFAIAAHLDPEVLIIDEVLSVGDLAFQERAFARISEMVKSGIPVVLVSHQLDRVATLCTKAIFLEQGRVRMAGSPESCIAEYVLKPARTTEAESRASYPVRIHALHVQSESPIGSGNFVQLVLSGEADEGANGRFDPYNISVRSAQTGKLVFRVQGTSLGLGFPAVGPFTAHIELQMNVPAGIYAIESGVRERYNGQFNHGPVAYVQVADGVRFEGNVQMNPRFRVTHNADLVTQPL